MAGNEQTLQRNLELIAGMERARALIAECDTHLPARKRAALLRLVTSMASHMPDDVIKAAIPDLLVLGR